MTIHWFIPIVFSLFSAHSGSALPSFDLRFAQGDDSLTVYVFLHDECVISQFYTPLLSNYYENYRDKKVGFAGYFPNPSTGAEQIISFGKNFHLEFPLLSDHDKFLTKKFGITVTPEVAVWDHRTDRLIYRGRIDDSYVRVGKRKLHPKSNDLKSAIDNWLAGEVPSSTVETQAIGCFINFGNFKG